MLSKAFIWFLVSVSVSFIGPCDLYAKDATMILSSPAFSDGARIPILYTRPAVGGKDISPPLTWSKPPNGSKSLALSVVDIHPVAKNWVHWLVINIPADVIGLQEGASGKAMPQDSRELINSFGTQGYGGPQPPPGTGDHPYVFTLYALDIRGFDLPLRTNLQQFLHAIQGHIVAESSLTGYFGR